MRSSVISTKDKRQWQGIPGVERAPNGRLWCTFFSGGPQEPDPANRILLTSSADDGITWGEPVVVVDPPGATRAYDPALWHDPSGRLWLIYNQANLETRAFDLWAMTTGDAREAAPHWSAPRRIAIAAPFAFRLNKPTVLTSGEWLLPVTWAHHTPAGWFPHAGQLQGVAVSADAGESWALHGAAEAPPWALENMIVEQRDGRLWMLIRTGSGVLWQSFSDDRGRTWGAASPTAIINPGVRFCLRRLASGRLLLINTPDPAQRHTLYAYLSDPQNDASFSHGLLLDPREKVSYPDAVQAPDDTIYAVHDCDRQGLGEIVLDTFTEDEILAAPAR